MRVVCPDLIKGCFPCTQFSHFVFIPFIRLFFKNCGILVFRAIHKNKILVEIDLSLVNWEEGHFKRETRKENEHDALIKAPSQL